MVSRDRTADLVGTDAIERAHARLDGVVVRTPLLAAPWLEELCGGTLRLKCENFQRAGAFKIRGAYTAIDRLPATDRSRGVITYSSGNHAQAVALAAKLFSVPAVVVMPTTAPDIKVDGARRLGAEVFFEGTTSLERRARAELIAEQRGLTIVPPFDHPDVIAGQGTVGREILQDWPDVDAVLVPVGGGGLLSGVAAWVKRANPRCTVIGVEPKGADAMTRSRQLGRPTTIGDVRTIADGLAPTRPGDLTFQHANELVDDLVTVDDEHILTAASHLLNDGKLLVEYSGAATVAAILAKAWVPGNQRIVCILSGGNRRINDDAARG